MHSLASQTILGIASAGFLLAGLALEPAQAKDLSQAQGELESIEGELQDSRARKQRFEDEMAALSLELRATKKRLVKAAGAAQDQEDKVRALDERLAELSEEEKAGTEELDRRYQNLAQSVAAMQRLSRRPLGAMIVRPASINDSARTAIMLDSIVPALQEQADHLNAQLEKVEALRQEISQEREELTAEETTLGERQHEIAKLLAEKEIKQDRLNQAIDREKARLQELASEAESLGALISKLEAEAYQQRGKDGRQLGQDGLFEGPPFSSARGTLPLPARGRVVRLFNETDASGQLSPGIVLDTMVGAQVIAPWDGKVVFAGTFRDYGQLLIISHGEGYHTLLAGMSRIDAVVAQWVLAGEPVGQMSVEGDVAQAQSEPKLYIELRRNGRSINPLPWLAVDQGKVSG